MKPRNLWSPSDYAKAQGRDRDTASILRAKVSREEISPDQARKLMEDQGYDPSLLGVGDSVKPKSRRVK